jgi:prepilin-type N-terminal cleavage/methylation domain-containing protein
MAWTVSRGKSGVTLIELLLALVLSSILTAALYHAFISQQKTYTIQDQVAEMQQNVRIALGQMTKEIRMAGYGGDMLSVFGNINGFTDIITPGSNTITILFADQVGVLKQSTAKGTNQLKVTNARVFNTDKKKYLCLNGLNNYLVQGVTEDTIILAAPLAEGHPINQHVYLVKAISYYLGLSGAKTVLRRNENTGGGGQPVADDIESLEFTYFDANGNVTSNPTDIRMVTVAVTAKTNMSDPQLKGGDGYRRRTLSSSIKVRNMGLYAFR